MLPKLPARLLTGGGLWRMLSLFVSANGFAAGTEQDMTPHYRQSFIAALTGHFVLISAAIVVSILPGCRRRTKPVDLSSFENIDITKIESFNKLERKKPAPEHPIPPPPTPPAAMPEPVMPDAPVPPRPHPVADHTPPTPPEQHDAEGTVPERTPPRDPIKPAHSNAAGPTVATPIKIGPHMVKILSGAGPQRPFVARPLKPGDLDPLGGINAPLGDSNSVPMDERQRCLLLIKRALYDAWERPTMAEAGRQAALLEIRFDLSGRVVSSSIAQSSGSEAMDRSVLQAARAAVRVEGLTPGFIKEFPTLPIEFRVTE